MESRTGFCCPACKGDLKPLLVYRNRFCPHCGQTIRVKRWRGFRFSSEALQVAAFVGIIAGAAKLHVFHWPSWLLCGVILGVLLLFSTWDSIIFALFPPPTIERVESILTLGIDRAG